MSRIGRTPVEIPKGVKCELSENSVRVEGPKGKLSLKLPRGVSVLKEDGLLKVERSAGVRLSDQKAKSVHGLTRALIRNMVEGVVNGYERKLEIIGAGFRPTVQGAKLSLTLGFSHPVVVSLPENVKAVAARVETGGRGEERHIITLTSCDKAGVGELAARIRRIKPADAYKGKGIRYLGEIVRRKPGKAAVATAGAAGGGK